MAGATVDIVTTLYERGMHHVLHKIFNQLDPISLKSVENTCLAWRRVLEVEKVWQKLFSKYMKHSSDWRSFNNVLDSLNHTHPDPNNNQDGPDSGKCVLLYEAVKTYENSWQNRECRVETLALMKKEFKLSTMDHFEMNDNYIIFLLRESHAVKVFNRWTLEQQCVFKMPSFEVNDTIRLGDSFIVGIEDEAYVIMDFKTRTLKRISEDPDDVADDSNGDETNDSWYSLDSTAGPEVTHLCAYSRYILSVVNVPDLRETRHQSRELTQHQQHLILRGVGESLDVSVLKRTVIPPEVGVLNMDLDERHVAIVALVKPRHLAHVPAIEEQGNWELRVLSTATLDTLYRVPNWPSFSAGIDHFAHGLLVTIMGKSVWVWSVGGSAGIKIEDSSSIISACVLSSKYVATTNSTRKLKIWELGEGTGKPVMFCCLNANLIPAFPRSHKQIAIIGGDKYQITLAARDVFKFSLYGDALSKFYRVNFLPRKLQKRSPIVRVLELPSDAATRQRPASRRHSAI